MAIKLLLTLFFSYQVYSFLVDQAWHQEHTMNLAHPVLAADHSESLLRSDPLRFTGAWSKQDGTSCLLRITDQGWYIIQGFGNVSDPFPTDHITLVTTNQIEIAGFGSLTR